MNGFFARAKRAWSKASENNIGLLAAGIAYYAFLALVPLLASIVLTYGLVADPETVARHGASLAERLPASATELVTRQLESVTEAKSGAAGLGLLAAIALALFGARNGAMAVITGMNVAFHADGSRDFLKANLLALAITAGAILAFGIVAGASALAGLLVAGVAKVAGFAIVAAAGFGGAALIFRITPNRPSPAWRDILPGAAIFAVGWTAASSAFGFYAASFGSYNATYGSLSAVIVLLTWLYLSGFLLLLGAHFSAAHSRQTV